MRCAVIGAWAVWSAAAHSAEPAKIDWTALRQGADKQIVRRHVEFLASDALEGRRPGTPGSAEARKYIISAFREFGLKPAFGDSFEQMCADNKTVNVAAWLPADDPKAEVVVVVAHYDHIGRFGGTIHAGADDNASGVAILLEVARLAAKSGVKPKCSLMFYCPDSEEYGFVGSRRFVSHPPVPIERFRCALVMDLMGGDVAPTLKDRFFVMGTEFSAALAECVAAVPAGADAKHERLSLAMIEAVPFFPLQRRAVSDYDAFRDVKRPFLFLSAGRTTRYHTPQDKPETLNYAKMAGAAQFLLETSVRIAELPKEPDWESGKIDVARDIAALGQLLDALEKDAPAGLDPRVAEALKQDRRTLTDLGAKAATGKLAGEEIRKVQMISVRLQLAAWQPKTAISLGFK